MNIPTESQHPPRKSHQPGRVGSVTVEMAILAPLLIFLMFGMVDFGLVLKNQFVLSSACREAARVAGIGSPTAQIIARAASAAATLSKDPITAVRGYPIYAPDTDSWRDWQPTYVALQITAVLEYRSYAPDTGWSDWQPLGDTEDLSNNAPTNSQVKATLIYPHSLLTGLLVKSFRADPSTRIVPLWSAVVIRRE